MKELIFLHIGQAGVQIGDQCWELFKQEHSLNEYGILQESGEIEAENDGIGTLFQETRESKFVPRCLFIDLEPSVTDQIRNGNNRKMFSCDQFISGKEDAAGNFARGRYTVGRSILSTCENRIRKLVESCYDFSGFVFFNSVGGGTGSGLGSRLYESLEKSYEKKNRVGISIYPSPKLATAITEPYNTVLATDKLREHSNALFFLDNEALYNICENHLDVEYPNYANVNQIIAQITSFLTASMRFKGDLNQDLNEMINNLVIYPKMQFMIQSYAPFLTPYSICQKPSLMDLTNQVFKPSNMLAKCDPRKGKYLACQLLYKGDVMPEEIVSTAFAIKDRQDVQFVENCEANLKVGVNWEQSNIQSWCNFPKADKSLCMCANSSSVRHLFSQINKKFDKIYAKRAFVHWYVQEGMEEGEFSEGREIMEILKKDYETAEKN